jgi:hypothetical protein
MIPGFRYHIATIAAIFLALGVGIIIGSSFVQSAIVQRQTHQLEDLKNQFNTEVLSLRDENRRDSDFLSALSPRILGNQMTGMHVALLQTGDYPETTRRIQETVEQAGATISSVTTLDRDFDNRLIKNLSDILDGLQKNHPSLPRTESAAFKALAYALSRGGTGEDITPFSDNGLLQQNGDYTQKNDLVIMVGGAAQDQTDRATIVDLPLALLLKKSGSTVLYAEPSDCTYSYISDLSDADITTVDDADLEIGRITLVLALHSTRGNYGVKKTAQSGILPPSDIYHDLHNNSGL